MMKYIRRIVPVIFLFSVTVVGNAVSLSGTVRENWLIGYVVLILLLLFLVLVLIYRYRLIIKRKNRALAHNVDQLLILSDELNLLRKQQNNISPDVERETSSSNMDAEQTKEEIENRQIFEELNRILIDRKLYLNLDLSREDLMKLIHVGKTRFAQIIQENTGGNLKEYINGLRIDYALHLLKEHPDYTFETIATEAGFINRGTFNLAFRKKVGMTPTQYKNL